MQGVYGGQDMKQRRGIHTYEAPWNIYGMNWSVRTGSKFRLAVGSFIEDFRNRVETHVSLLKNHHQQL
jgi:WD repeat-containing protein 68